MSYLRFKNGFPSMSDANLLGKTNSIVTSLTENFATAPLLPALIAERDAFSAAVAIAVEGSRVQKAEKNEIKTSLIDKLHQMGFYVLMVCNGDRTMALKSGFTLAKTPTPTAPVGPVQNLKTENGMNSGEVKISF